MTLEGCIGYDGAMAKITVLDASLVNQIAAGEVVERPSSVVKELVENAIDAGATHIDITAKDGGRSLRIADNGCGMGADDLSVAFLNHATSKMKTLDDLFHMMTLGFRGEALASIAAISRVTCTSRPANQPVGLKATVQPNGDVALTETGCATGTIMDIADLFYNVPARLKFLKRSQTELAHIQDMVQMLALSHPEIRLTLTLENSEAVKTSGSGDLGKTIAEVFSLGSQDVLLPINKQDEGYAVTGLTSAPHTYRSSRKWMVTLVNGRVVRCPILLKAVESAYTSMITPGKYPVSVVHLTLPHNEVDVNIHPTKKEIKYQNGNTIFSFVRTGIDQALLRLAESSRTQRDETSTPIQPTGQSAAFRPQAQSYTPATLAPATYRPAMQSATQAFYRPTMTVLPHTPVQQQMDVAAPYRVIGQLAKTYILVETDEGLMVVDQHIASERVHFERLKDQAERHEIASQGLLIVEPYPIAATLTDTLEQNREVLTSLGFEFILSPTHIEFTRVPGLYTPAVRRRSLEGLLQRLEECGDAVLDADDVIATAACHTAIRAGDVLQPEAMQRVITEWHACERPWTCPHGRPVYRMLTHREIMAYFDRPSLPR